jgi:hypothetical protein
MSLAGIFQLSERSLKGVCILLGLVFVAIAVLIWQQGELQANKAEALLLVPLLSAVVLIVGAAALRKEALRVLVLAWLVGGPVLLWAVNTVGCGARWFSTAWCQ